MGAFKVSGKRIKKLREISRFSQANIAAFLNVNQSFVSKVESEQCTLSSDMAERLACLFGVHQTALQEEGSDAMPLVCTLCANEITRENMNTISAINRIALNCDFLGKVLHTASQNTLN